MKELAPVVPWQVLAETSLVSQRWLEVREQHVRLANGNEIERFHLVRGPHWASVLCLTASNQVVLVRQYRHGIAGGSLELPAGVIDTGEEPLSAARRELREETGFSAQYFEPLITVAAEPARNSARAHFFVATGAERAAEQALDETEELEVLLVEPRELFELIDAGHIVHGVHIAAILLAARRGFL